MALIVAFIKCISGFSDVLFNSYEEVDETKIPIGNIKRKLTPANLSLEINNHQVAKKSTNNPINSKINIPLNNEYLLPTFCSHRLLNTTLDYWPYQVLYNSHNLSNNMKSFLNGSLILIPMETILSKFMISEYNSLYDETFQIDNYKIEYHGYSTNKRNYTIKNVKNPTNLKNVSSHQDMIMCAKYLLLICNEIHFNFINMKAYDILVSWIRNESLKYDIYDRHKCYPNGW